MDPSTANLIANQSRAAIFVQKVDSLMRFLPMLQVGDILQLVVRQNYGNGQGLIAVQGQVLQAAIPSDMQVGQKVFAQLTDVQDKVTLKILEGYQPLADRIVAVAEKGFGDSNAILFNITTQLEQIARKSGVSVLASGKSFDLPDGLRQLVTHNPQIAQLFSAIQSMEELFDPKNIQAQLVAATSGSLSETLRATAVSLRNLFDLSTSIDFSASLSVLQESMDKLLKSSLSDSEFSKKIADVLDRVSQRLKEPLNSELQEKFLSQIYKDLYVLRSRPELAQTVLQKSISETTVLLQTLNKVLERSTKSHDGLSHGVLKEAESFLIQQNSNNQNSVASSTTRPIDEADSVPLDPQLLMHLREVASKLDQMAVTAETLNRLNPIMQALGEPALVLFPFLFDGLVSQNEVALNPQKKRQPNTDDEERQSEDRESSKEGQAPFQQIQLNVPLPSMGIIDVMIAHRPGHIMVKFTTGHAHVKEFISTRLEELDDILKSQGFQISELSTTLGKPKNATPEWCITLRGDNSFIA